MKRSLCLLTLAAAMLALPAFAQQSAWNYSTKTGLDGQMTETAIALQSDGPADSATLVVRCKKTCEAYLALDNSIAADQPTVQVKFNDGPLQTFAVSRGEGSDSLFFKTPARLLKAIRDNGGYLKVEYRPYEKTPVISTFGVWNLPPTILARMK
jgi:hypothetical protein